MIRNVTKLVGIREKITEQVDDKSRRLFAIVHFHMKQFRVIEGDIIHVEHSIPLQFGDKIKLEKVGSFYLSIFVLIMC
jgi:hypothetical protein